MKNVFKNLSSNKSEEIEINPLVNVEQQKQILNNPKSDNILLLKDLSLDEKLYVEREIEFKYDCSKYEITKIDRSNKDYLLINLKLLNGTNISSVTEKILYEKIKSHFW